MGLGIKTKLRSFLERQLNRQYADRLAGAKRRITYEEWLQLREGRDSSARQEQGNQLLRERGIWLIRQRDG